MANTLSGQGYDRRGISTITVSEAACSGNIPLWAYKYVEYLEQKACFVAEMSCVDMCLVGILLCLANGVSRGP